MGALAPFSYQVLHVRILMWGIPSRFNALIQWKRINCKQSARWQHLSRLKASAVFSLQKKLVSCVKCNNLYSGLVTPSSGWWSPIDLTSSKPYIFTAARKGKWGFGNVTRASGKAKDIQQKNYRKRERWAECQWATAMLWELNPGEGMIVIG